MENRRYFLGRLATTGVVGAVTALSPLVTGCQPFEKPTPTPNPETPLNENKLTSMLEALRKVNQPFLTMIVNHIDQLHHARSLPPPEFPFWMNKNMVPLSITTNQGDTNYTNFGAEWDNDPRRAIVASNLTDRNTLSGIKTLNYNGISLQKNILTESNEFADGILLAGQHIGAMTTIQFSTYFYPLAASIGIRLNDYQNKPIMDPTAQTLAGAAYFATLYNAHNQSVVTALTGSDVFPIGETIRQMIDNHIISPTAAGFLRRPYIAAQEMQNMDHLPQHDQYNVPHELDDIMQQWTKTGTFLPPPHLLEVAFSSDMVIAVKNYLSAVIGFDKKTPMPKQ